MRQLIVSITSDAQQIKGRIAALVAVAALGCLATACQNSGGDVVSLVTPGISSDATGPEPQQQIDAIDACLEQHDVPARILYSEDGMSVEKTSSEASLTCFGGQCVYWGADGASPGDAASQRQFELYEAMRAAKGLGDTADLLFVGDVDFTDQFAACLLEAKFNQADFAPTPQDELKVKALIAAAGQTWAECVRQSKLSAVSDPAAPIADGYFTRPTALLPAAITEARLRDVLAACPPVPAAKTVREEDIGDATIYSAAALPEVGFDYPGFDGKGGTPPEDETSLRLDRLSGIVIQVSQAAWEELPEKAD
ncbi:MAG: hypothetical protein LBJ62_01875 [Bifidobacteriaceae bacterium]|nr:hypothetical protein [Bifidobacteriaceae bacterium]